MQNGFFLFIFLIKLKLFKNHFSNFESKNENKSTIRLRINSFMLNFSIHIFFLNKPKTVSERSLK